MGAIQGKYTRIDPDNPKAVAQCDLTGLLVMHEDLVPEMAYRGNALVPTGFLVYKDFWDIPNPQAMTPIILPDPIPIQQPRPTPGLGSNEYYENTIYLTNNPMQVTQGSNVVTVTLPLNHGLVANELVTINYATSLGGIQDNFINGAAILITVGATTCTYIPSNSATNNPSGPAQFSETGGGDVVTITKQTYQP